MKVGMGRLNQGAVGLICHLVFDPLLTFFHAAALRLRRRVKDKKYQSFLIASKEEKRTSWEGQYSCFEVMQASEGAGPNVRNVQLYPLLIFSPKRDPLERKFQVRIGFFLQCQQLLCY